MRRTGILFLLFLFGIGSLLAQSLSLNYIEFHGSGGVTDQVISAGETVTVRAMYDAVNMNSVDGVYRGSAGASKGSIYVLWYDEEPPADTADNDRIGISTPTISNFTYDSAGTVTDQYCEFTFVLPTPPGSAATFEIAFGIYGDGGGLRAEFLSDRGLSYSTLSTEGGLSSLPGDTADGGTTNTPTWFQYGQMDTTTESPTLTTPANGSLDNASIDVSFTLPEAAASGTVKLYIDDDTNIGNGVVSTLVLTSTYEAAGTHSFTLDGANLDGYTAIVSSRTGLDALTNGTTYYWTIGFDDSLNNGEATDGPNSMAYDTVAETVLNVLGTDNGDGTVDVVYELQEDASDLWIVFYDDDLSIIRARVQIDGDYASSYLSGALRTIDDLDATNLGSEVGTKLLQVDGSYSASLVDGHNYQVKIDYDDLAENNRICTCVTTFLYSNDTSTETPTGPSAAEAFNTTDDAPALTVGYTLPEAGHASYVDVLIDDAAHGTVGNETALNTLWIINTTGEEAIGAHSFKLSVPFTTSDNAGDGDQVNSITTNQATNQLQNGVTYYYALRYRDAAGNAYARTTSWIAFTWDGATASFAGFTAPTIDNYYKSGDNVPVTYQLGEIGLDGSVEINIYGGPAGGESDLYTTCYLATGQTLNNTSPHTISLSPANLSSATQVSSASPNNSLPDDSDGPEDYWFEVVYRDSYGNTEVATASKRHIYFDDATIAPTLTAPVAGGSTTTTDIGFDYTLGETMTSVYIDFTGQGNVPTRDENSMFSNASDDQTELSRDVTTHTLQLTGAYLVQGNHQFTIDGSDLAALADMSLTSGTNALTAQEDYDIRIRVVDLAGNTQQSTTNSGYTYQEDVTTDTPTISAPALNSYQNGTISFTFNLPEAGSAGAVQILFDDDASHTTVYETLTFSGENGAGDHTVTLENMGSSISGNTEVSASAPNNSLADNSGAPKQYSVAVKYQDADGNPAATSAWHTFYFDNETLPINLDAPAASSTITGSFDVQYDLQEAALAGNSGLYLKFVCTSAVETDRTFAISSHAAGSDITISNIDPTDINAHASLTLYGLGSTSLTLGETYTISIHTRDLANNTEQSDSHVSVTYNTAVSVLNVTNIPLADAPLGGASSTDQQIIHFSLAANSLQTVDLEGLSFTISGTAVTGDFVSNSFDLYEDTDNNNTPDVQIWSSTSISTPLVYSGAAITITDSPRYFYVICDLDATIDASHTIRLTLSSTGVTSDASSTAGFPIQGRSLYLEGYLAEVDGAGTGNGNIAPGDEEAVLYWYLTTNQGEDTFSTVTVQMATDDWNDIASVNIYSNTSNTLVGATLLDTENAPSGTSVSFTPDATIGTTRTYFLVSVDVDAGATDPTHTVQASVDAYTDMVFASYSIPASLQANFPIEGDSHQLPVELSSFNITNSGQTVKIAWTTETETDNAGFNLYRGISATALTSGQAIQLNPELIAGAGDSSLPTDYDYNDEYRVEYNTTYYYWLETVNLSGASSIFAPVAFTPISGNGDNPIPGYVDYGLHQNYPNPFNPETTISFIMPQSGMTSVAVYNMRGQLIKQVFNGDVTAEETNSVIWDGRDDSGREVGSGVYFYRLRQGSHVETKQMILMK